MTSKQLFAILFAFAIGFFGWFLDISLIWFVFDRTESFWLQLEICAIPLLCIPSVLTAVLTVIAALSIVAMKKGVRRIVLGITAGILSAFLINAVLRFLWLPEPYTWLWFVEIGMPFFYSPW